MSSLNDLLKLHHEQLVSSTQPLAEMIKSIEEKMSGLRLVALQNPDIVKFTSDLRELAKKMNEASPNVKIGELMTKAMISNISMPSVSIELPLLFLKTISDYSVKMAEDVPVMAAGEANLSAMLQGVQQDVAEIKQSISEMRQESNTDNTMTIKLFVWGTIISIFLTLLGNDQFRAKFESGITELFQTYIETELPTEIPSNFDGGEKS